MDIFVYVFGVYVEGSICEGNWEGFLVYKLFIVLLFVW